MNLANFFLFLVILTFAQMSFSNATRKIYRVKSNSAEKLHYRNSEKCLAEHDPELRIIADELCHFCHEMFSHVNPNLRAQCSSECYKNAQFRKCLEMYTALPDGHPGGTAETKRNANTKGKAAEEKRRREGAWKRAAKKQNGNNTRDKLSAAIAK